MPRVMCRSPQCLASVLQATAGITAITTATRMSHSDQEIVYGNGDDGDVVHDEERSMVGGDNGGSGSVVSGDERSVSGGDGDLILCCLLYVLT